VWVRDLGRCAFVSENGRPCNERGFVEFHHVQPLRRRRPGHGGEHPAPVSCAQRIRGRPLLRAGLETARECNSARAELRARHSTPHGQREQAGLTGPLGRTERNVYVVPRGFNGVQAKIPPDVYREGVGGR